MLTRIQHNTNRAVKAGFTGMLALVLIFGLFSLYQLHNITLEMTNTVAKNSEKIIHIVFMRDAVSKRQLEITNMLSITDPFEFEERRLVFFSLAGAYRNESQKLAKLTVTAEEEFILKKIAEIMVAPRVQVRQGIDILLEEPDSEEGVELITLALRAHETVYKLLSELITLQDKNTQEFVKNSGKQYSATLNLSIIIGVIIFFIAWLIAKTTSKFINQKNKELIAQNKLLEETSVQANEATRVKSEFLAVMSHEIRTPLTSIIGYAEALSEDSTHIEDRVSLTKTIVKNGNHLLKIINDILDISKIEANKMIFENSYFSPIELVSDIEDAIKKQFNEKGIEFYIEYEFPIPEVICNDALRTKQIILNVCGNALKFTKSGKVSIKINCNIESEKIYFSVIDSGIGMTKEQMDKVFCAFTQADSSTTRKYGGTGLGLSLSKQFAEKMGGNITIESLLDIGSQFCISISTGKIDQQKLISGVPELPEMTYTFKQEHTDTSDVSGSILVVEDNHDNQQLMSILLHDIGAEITFAENGQQAIDKTLNKKFDLIFMDMQMPVMGGIEATKKLREANYTNPIVALTVNAMKSDYNKCMEAGCDGFLTKPINRDEIFQTIYKYLKKNDGSNAGKGTQNTDDEQSDKMKSLIIRFLNELPKRLKDIEESRNNKNWELMGEVLHKLKGLGTPMGYPQITEIAAELGNAADKGNEEEIDKLFSKIKLTIDDIVSSSSDL